MINFIIEKDDENILTFGHVKQNQFFISSNGYLCQKVDRERYNIISKPDGSPWGGQNFNVSKDNQIHKILSHVTKIEF